MKKIHLAIEHPVGSDKARASAVFSAYSWMPTEMHCMPRYGQQLDESTLIAISATLQRGYSVKVIATTRSQLSKLVEQVLAQLDTDYPRRGHL